MTITPIRFPTPLAITPDSPAPGAAGDAFGQALSQAIAKVEGFHSLPTRKKF